MTPIIIKVGRQLDGCVFELAGKTRVALEKQLKMSHAAPNVFIGASDMSDFASYCGLIWLPVASMLTGLPEQELRTARRKVVFVEPVSEEPLFTPSHEDGRRKARTAA